MGLEMFSVGFLICFGLIVLGILLSLLFNILVDEYDGFGFFIVMFFSLIGFGICLTYIIYERGLL